MGLNAPLRDHFGDGAARFCSAGRKFPALGRGVHTAEVYPMAPKMLNPCVGEAGRVIFYSRRRRGSMHLMDRIEEQMAATQLPLFAITLAAVPCPDTPIILTLHWHAFVRERTA